MRIPGGDLAPARRRRYGGSYGRRRRQRRLRVLTAVVLLGAAGGGAYLLQRDDAKAPVRRQAAPPPVCPTPSPVAAPRPVRLPQPQQVSLALLNGTNRSLLAKTVGDQLAADGFHVTAQANAPAALDGASTVAFGPGGEPAATVVAHWVTGAQLVPDAHLARGAVRVVLGSGFSRLATPAEAAAA
ncbi:MAG: LytR C-terminal domain-containing protein, partial [Mycobacteriales bacterium]